MKTIDVRFTIGSDDDSYENFRLLEMESCYDFDIHQKITILNVIRRGLIDKEIAKVTHTVNTLHKLARNSGELTKLIESQTKLLEGLKNNGN